ncbi:MAG: GntR family transcriptional regulator [Planctomycetota bacterium]
MNTATSPTRTPKTSPLHSLRGVSGRQLCSRLAELIRSGRLGADEVFPSERQLSSDLQLSRGTVRKALAALENQGLLSNGGQGRIRQVNAPRSANSIMSRTVVIVGFDRMPNERVASETGWETYAQFTASAKLQELGWHCLTINPDEATPAQIELLGQDRPAGVLFSRPLKTDATRQMIERFESLGLTVAAYGGPDEELLGQCDRIFHDHTAGAAALTHWLIEQGRQRILPFWRFPEHFGWIHERESGYQQAMSDAGLTALEPVRTPDLRLKADGEPFDDMVRLQMGFLYGPLLGDDPIDALMCANDLHAAEAAEAVRRLGKEPGKDMLIVGYDNTWQRDARNPDRIDPPAATIDKQNDKVGVALAELLYDRIQGRLPQEPQHLAAAYSLLTPRLTIHEHHSPSGGNP